MILIEFVLARIVDDERDARQRIQMGEGLGIPTVKPSPNRVLAECEAKRQVLAILGFDQGEVFMNDWAREIVCALALPYADHPDYREEWKP